MEDIRLLVVEDDSGQITAYGDAIEEYNSRGGNRFVPQIEKSADKCIALLKSADFDAAVVDLNLMGDPNDEASGNRVLREIRGSHRFPIFVVTGTPGKLDADIEKNIFLEVFDRGVGNLELLEKIDSIFRTGITKILGLTGELERLIQQVFWKHISSGFGYWVGMNSEAALLRYSISHLTEYLAQPGADGLDGFYCEPEFYITPPIKEDIATGDIIEKDSERYIVMSPACDLEPRIIDGGGKSRNTKDILLVRILDLDEVSLRAAGYLNAEQTLTKKRVENFVKNDKQNLMFLPDYHIIKRAVIDFRKISTIPIDAYPEYRRLATVAMPFLKDIQGRFSQYYGRQGQPDLDADKVVDKIIGKS